MPYMSNQVYGLNRPVGRTGYMQGQRSPVGRYVMGRAANLMRPGRVAGPRFAGPVGPPLMGQPGRVAGPRFAGPVGPRIAPPQPLPGPSLPVVMPGQPIWQAALRSPGPSQPRIQPFPYPTPTFSRQVR